MKSLLYIFRWQSMIKPELIQGDILTNKQIYRRTFDIAWPSAIESILIALIGAVDLMMVGGIGKEAISAVGITNQPKFIILATIIALNMAVTVLVSRRKGENNKEEANKYLINALSASIIISLVLSILGIIFSKEFMAFAGATNDYIYLASDYFKIIMIGNFFNCMALTMTSAQRGAGNTKISMKTNLAANIVNLILNALLINGLFFFPKLGVYGAGIATSIGNLTAFFIALYSCTRKGKFLYLKIGNLFKFNLKYLKDIYALASATLVEQLFLRIGFLMYAKAVAGLGTVAFSAHQIVMSIMSISFSVGDGLSIANTSLVGQSLGAKRKDMAIIYGKVSQRIGLIMAILTSLIITIFRAQIMSLYANDLDVITMGELPLIILSVTVIFQISQVITIGSLRGAGDVKFVAILMLVSVTIIRPSLTWIFCYPMNMGLAGAWFSVFVDQLTRFFISAYRFKQSKWIDIKV